MVQVSASVMCVDMGHIEDSIRELENVGADMLHLDVADGHFVPNLLLGPDVIRWLRPKTKLPLDAHLMVTNPGDYINLLADIGVDYLSIHAEACLHLDRLLTQILDKGMKAGVALNPATPLNVIEYVVERLDFVLLMTVNPGFAGGKLVPSAFRKIADCRKMLDGRGCGDVSVLVDGNVSFANIPKMVAAGGDILVTGSSSWFNSAAPLEENVEKTKKAIEEGLKMRGNENGE